MSIFRDDHHYISRSAFLNTKTGEMRFTGYDDDYISVGGSKFAVLLNLLPPKKRLIFYHEYTQIQETGVIPQKILQTISHQRTDVWVVEKVMRWHHFIELLPSKYRAKALRKGIKTFDEVVFEPIDRNPKRMEIWKTYLK